MAVALYSSGTGYPEVSSGANTEVYTTCDSAGTNRVALLVLQLYPHATAPTGVTADFDSEGTNQSMTLIESWFSGNVYHYMFGVIAPVVGTGRACTASWSGICAYCAHVSVWTGAMQSSVSEAFINPAHATNSSGLAQLTVTSAVNGVVVGHYNCAANVSEFIELSLFAPEYWGLGGEYGWGGYSGSAASSTMLQAQLESGSQFWRVQGVFIPQFATPTGHPTRKRFGGVTHAQVVKGKNTRVW